MKKTLINIVAIAIILFLNATLMFAIVGEVPTGFKITLGALAIFGIVAGLFERKVLIFLEKLGGRK